MIEIVVPFFFLLFSIQFDQTSFGLPSRDYFLKPSSKKEREAYLKLMVELAVLLGARAEYAQKEMIKVLDFETKLANVRTTHIRRSLSNLFGRTICFTSSSPPLLPIELRFELKASMPEADRQDTGAIYKKLTLKELQSVTPEFDWSLYLNTFMPIKIEMDEPVVVYAFSYLIDTIKIMQKTDPRVIHNYAIWRLVRQLCAYLGTTNHL